MVGVLVAFKIVSYCFEGAHGMAVGRAFAYFIYVFNGFHIFYLITLFNIHKLVTTFEVVHNMKICLRYPPPKSSSSGGGLAIASLKVFYLITLFNIHKLVTLHLCRDIFKKCMHD